MLARHMPTVPIGNRQHRVAVRPQQQPAALQCRPKVVLKAVAEPAAGKASSATPPAAKAEGRIENIRRVGLGKTTENDNKAVGILMGKLKDGVNPYLQVNGPAYITRGIRVLRSASDILLKEDSSQVVEVFVQRRAPSSSDSKAASPAAASQPTAGDQTMPEQRDNNNITIRFNMSLVSQQLPAVPFVSGEAAMDKPALDPLVKVGKQSKALNLQNSILMRLEELGEAVVEAIGTDAQAVAVKAINGATVRSRIVHQKRVASYLSSFTVASKTEGRVTQTGTRFVVRTGPLPPREQPAQQ